MRIRAARVLRHMSRASLRLGCFLCWSAHLSRSTASFGLTEGVPAPLHAYSPPPSKPVIHVGFLACGEPSKYLDIAQRMMLNIDNVTSAPVHYHAITDVPHEQAILHMKSYQPASFSSHNVKDITPEVQRVFDGLGTTVAGFRAETARLYMYKPILHKIMPQNLSKVIILDLDIWVTMDLAELWQEFDNFAESHLLGAALEQQPSYFPCWVTDDFVKQFGALGFSGFNGGLQLLNLQRMRRSQEYNAVLQKTDWFEAQKAELNQRNSSCTGGDGWNLGDQDLYTILASRHMDWFYHVPCRWNIQQCKYWQKRHQLNKQTLLCPAKAGVIHGNCGEWKDTVGLLQYALPQGNCRTINKTLSVNGFDDYPGCRPSVKQSHGKHHNRDLQAIEGHQQRTDVEKQGGNKKNVVLSVAFGKRYTPQLLSPFVMSARAHIGDTLEIVLLIDVNKSKTADWITFCTKFSIQMQVMSTNDDTIETARIPEITKWLRGHQKSGYAHVAVLDARDTYFQGDPFRSLSTGLHVSCEQVGRGGFGHEGFYSTLNRMWITKVHNALYKCKPTWPASNTASRLFPGADKFPFAHMACFNSFLFKENAKYHTFGVQMGDFTSMTAHFELVNAIWTEVLACKEEGVLNYGLDQGILNYIVKGDLSPSIFSRYAYKIVEEAFDDGPFSNAPCLLDPFQANSRQYPYSKYMNPKGLVTNRGGVVPLIHQYDKCQGLLGVLSKSQNLVLPQVINNDEGALDLDKEWNKTFSVLTAVERPRSVEDAMNDKMNQADSQRWHPDKKLCADLGWQLRGHRCRPADDGKISAQDIKVLVTREYVKAKWANGWMVRP